MLQLELDCCLLTKSCLILCDPVDCSPPGSSVRGISQARILEWVAISFSRGSSQPREPTSPALAGRFFFLPLSHWGNSAGLLGVSQIFQTLSCFHAFSQATQSSWDSPPCLLTWLTSPSPLEAHQLRAIFSKTHLSPAPLGEQAGLGDPPTYFPSICLPDHYHCTYEDILKPSVRLTPFSTRL